MICVYMSAGISRYPDSVRIRTFNGYDCTRYPLLFFLPLNFKHVPADTCHTDERSGGIRHVDILKLSDSFRLLVVDTVSLAKVEFLEYVLGTVIRVLSRLSCVVCSYDSGVRSLPCVVMTINYLIS